jgi:hypothetical protein
LFAMFPSSIIHIAFVYQELLCDHGCYQLDWKSYTPYAACFQVVIKKDTYETRKMEINIKQEIQCWGFSMRLPLHYIYVRYNLLISKTLWCLATVWSMWT